MPAPLDAREVLPSASSRLRPVVGADEISRAPCAISALSSADWRVFPLGRRGSARKRPALSGWRDAATCEPAALAALASAYPGCNWGAATGPGSGVWALNLDGAEGRRSLEALIGDHGPLPLAPCQRTGGGGLQLFFGGPADRAVRNSASKVSSNVDVHGEGGFVVVPPSIHPSGDRYRWLGGRAPWEIEPPQAPPWLLDLVAPPPKARKRLERPRIRGDRYARAALTQAVERVMAAPVGARNSTLNREAFGTARLIGDGLSDAAWRDALSSAGERAGLEAAEVERTLARALRGRMEAPHA